MTIECDDRTMYVLELLDANQESIDGNIAIIEGRVTVHSIPTSMARDFGGGRGEGVMPDTGPSISLTVDVDAVGKGDDYYAGII